jgi:hypothetical protein
MSFSKYYIGIFLLCAIAGITAKFLVLTPETVALMYMDSRMYEDAREKYEQMLAEGNESGNVIIPLTKIYALQGETKKAVGLLVRYINKKPDLLNAETALSLINKDSISKDGYAQILEKVATFPYPNDVLMDLSTWYESTLQDDKQIDVLTELAKKPDSKQNDFDYRKLVFYYTADMKFDTFSALVKQLVYNANPKNRRDPFFSSLTILVASEQYERATVLANKYLENRYPLDPFEVEKVTSIFLAAGQNRIAGEISVRFLNKKTSKNTMQISKYNLDMAKGDESKVLEEIKHDVASSSKKSKRIYDIGIKLAMKHGDSKLVKDILLRADREKLTEDEAFSYAFYALKNRDAELAEILNKKIGAEMLRIAPCLNYIIKSASKKISVENTASLACESTELDNDDLLQLGYLMFHNDCFKESILLIKDRPISKIFTVFKIRDLVNLIVSNGNPDEFADKCEKEMQLSSKNNRLLLRNTLFLLYSASGQDNRLDKLIAEQKDVPLPVLIDAYSLAESYGQYDAALVLAEAMSLNNQGDAFQYFLATALVDSGNFNRALSLLLKLKKTMRAAEGLFLKAVTRDIELCGQNRIPDDVRSEIAPSLNRILDRKDVTVSELKRASMCLAALGEREKAQRIYLKICQDEDIKMSDINEFAAMCKRLPMEDVRKWFIQQAETGRWEKWQRVSWLNQLGMEKETVNIVDNIYKKVELDYLSEYLTALHVTGMDKEAREALNRYNIDQLLKTPIRVRIGLINFLSKTGRWERSRQLLNSLSTRELVANLSPEDIASMFILTNMEKEGITLFSGPGVPAKSALNVLLFLNAYAGDEKFIDQWLDSSHLNPENTLITLYYFSVRAKRTGLALATARRLFKLYKTDDNRFRLAEALIAAKKYNEGIALINEDAEINNKAGEIYLSGISGLAQEGLFLKESPEAEKFLRICNKFIESPETPKATIIVVAFALSNTAYHDKAKDLFYDLALADPDLKDPFTKMYLFSTVTAPDRKDFKLITNLVLNTKTEDEQKLLDLLEAYNLQGHIMMLIEKRYGTDIPLHLYPKYLNCLLKCRQMRTFDIVVEKLPPPESFTEEDRGSIFETLILGEKDAESSIYYNALDKNKKGMNSSLVRRLGYHFANKKEYEKAIPVFFELAKASNDPESSDLSLLVSLPGIGKNQEFVDWLVSQAKLSKDEKQLTWLEFLNYIKRPEEVIEILKGYYTEKESKKTVPET